jgi:DNA-binding CsgD family transcriptional regulator
LLERARASSGVPVAARLSKREQEVLTLLAQNRTAASVASELSLSEEDLRMALASILLKLQAQNRAQAAVQAVRDRIV